MDLKEFDFAGNESESHRLSKKIIFCLLKKRNFNNFEIKLEYPIIFPTGKIRKIDIVAISKDLGEKICYEVGNLNGGSLEELYCFFNEVNGFNKITIEEGAVNEVLDYFDEEMQLNRLENMEFLSNFDEDYSYDLFMKKLFSNSNSQYLVSFVNEDSTINREKLLEYVEDEIDFVYNKISLDSNKYVIIKDRLLSYYIRIISQEVIKIKKEVDERKCKYIGSSSEKEDDELFVSKAVKKYDPAETVGYS